MKLRWIVAVLVVALAITAGLVIASTGWLRLKDAPRSGAFGEAIVNTNNAIYLAWNPEADSTPEFWRYNPGIDSWSAMSTEGLPAGAFRSGTALAWDRVDRIYALLGGRQNDTNRRDFYAYVITDDRWLKLENTRHPQGAGNALAWDHEDGVLYAFLGSSLRGSEFAVYEPATGWSLMPIHPGWDCTDDGASLAVASGRIYAIKGECAETDKNGLYAVYSKFESTWRSLAPVPDPGGVGDGASLIYPAAFSDQFDRNNLYALGGGSVGEDPGFGFYRYDIRQNIWAALPELECPVGWYVGNRLAVVLDQIHVWQGAPTTDRWICGGNAFAKLLQ